MEGSPTPPGTPYRPLSGSRHPLCGLGFAVTVGPIVPKAFTSLSIFVLSWENAAPLVTMMDVAANKENSLIGPPMSAIQTINVGKRFPQCARPGLGSELRTGTRLTHAPTACDSKNSVIGHPGALGLSRRRRVGALFSHPIPASRSACAGRRCRTRGSRDILIQNRCASATIARLSTCAHLPDFGALVPKDHPVQVRGMWRAGARDDHS